MRSGDEDRDLAHRRRQQRIRRDRLDQVPHRLAEARLADPGIPRPEQRAVVAHVHKALEVVLDARSHVVIERLLFGTQVFRIENGKAHGGISSLRSADTHLRCCGAQVKLP
ncbi:hypothetical protein ACVW1A_002443 [Bradyrhizobium sp. LB1.3]